MRIAAILAVAAVILSAGSADAHARLLHAVPRVGATVKPPPPELRLWFSESIDLRDSSIRLTGPDGRAVSIGRLLLDANDKRIVAAPLPADLAPGAYKVTWQVTSTDTHHTDGDFMFRIGP